ncbi:MAG: hypothetical protein COA91_05445 [Robiginitomaculum sp.]|nr:MAG: hypothetical protein COA91_05445 [Robiginitomaculum sp.]
MTKTIIISVFLAALPLQNILAQDIDFDAKHKICLEKTVDDPEAAFENAMVWQSQGGGRRARHCVAKALSALGHAGEAAIRMEKIAKAPDGGTPTMRAEYYVQAADLWLTAKQPHRAIDAASAGLKIARSNLDLRIHRARAYGALGRWDYSETDLTSALAFHPDNARALRARAHTYLKQDDLAKAKADIDASINADSTNIDTLLLRGKINEAIRLKPAPGEKTILLETQK